MQIAAHLEEATSLGKPLVLGEYGRMKPMADRNAFLGMIYDELATAAAAGLPLAGGFLWMLAEPKYPGYNG